MKCFSSKMSWKKKTKIRQFSLFFFQFHNITEQNKLMFFLFFLRWILPYVTLTFHKMSLLWAESHVPCDRCSFVETVTDIDYLEPLSLKPGGPVVPLVCGFRRRDNLLAWRKLFPNFYELKSCIWFWKEYKHFERIYREYRFDRYSSNFAKFFQE